MRRVLVTAIGLLIARSVYRLLARGSLTLDTGIGRRVRPLGPVRVEVAAPPDVVFDVIATPYLERTPRALESELEVWERGSDMVLAAHHTPVHGRVTTTVETVRFERPTRVDFRLVRGPVPHVVESFVLEQSEPGTRVIWEGELGVDYWALGEWWGKRVAHHWERAVRGSLQSITAEAERRAA